MTALPRNSLNAYDQTRPETLFLAEPLWPARFQRFIAYALLLHLLVVLPFVVRFPWWPRKKFTPTVISGFELSPKVAPPSGEKHVAPPELPATPPPQPTQPSAPTAAPSAPPPTAPPEEPPEESNRQSKVKDRNPKTPTPKPVATKDRASQSWAETSPVPTMPPLHPAIVPPKERTKIGTPGKGGEQKAGSMAVDQDFEFDYYLAAIMSKVSRNWNPMAGYLPSGGELISIVSFTVRKNGTIENIRITESCGKDSIDKQAIRAVQLSNPLPELPPAYTNSSLEVHFAFYVWK